MNLAIGLIEQINKIDFSNCSDSQLIEKSNDLKRRAEENICLDLLLNESFALIREVSHRVLNMRPFDVQMIAGIALHHGTLVEMQTGEGKTLAAVAPAFLNAITGKGVHILTFNDYLAKRDAKWMGPIFKFLGLSVGYIVEGMSPEERRKSYNCDVTYLTA